MVNALTLAAKILLMLPTAKRTPDTTAGRDGFIHAYALNGRESEATLSFILRDFEREGLQGPANCCKQSAPQCRPQSHAPKSPAPSPSSIATCVLPLEMTCAPWS